MRLFMEPGAGQHFFICEAGGRHRAVVREGRKAASQIVARERKHEGAQQWMAQHSRVGGEIIRKGSMLSRSTQW